MMYAYLYVRLPQFLRQWLPRPSFCALMQVDRVDDIQLDGIDPRDYPDFCDVFICGASWERLGEDLTDDELDALTDYHADSLGEWAYEQLI